MAQPSIQLIRRSAHNLAKPSTFTTLSRPLLCSRLSSIPSKPQLPTFSTTTMPPVPASQKAIQISRNGGVDVLEYNDIPVPKPGSGQLLVKNQYAGINFIDTYFRSGLYKAAQFPLTLGREGAGEVVSVDGSVSGFQVGQKVVYSTIAGSYQQYSVVEAKNAVVIPEGLSAEKAVASFLQGLTAWTFIREAGEVKAGQWTLVHAAAGGVGGLLLQMLRAVGAKIIATASTEEKLELARKYGADYTINSHDDIVPKVKEITGGHGVDVIFDGVGKVTFDADMEMIALKGHLISFGNAVSIVLSVWTRVYC